MDSIAANTYRRDLPDAFSLKKRDICFINQDIKVLLPNKNPIIMSNSAESSLENTPKSDLSADAATFIPRSSPLKSPNNFKQQNIVLPSYGEDWKIYHYIWNIDENGKLVPKLNVNVPPPKITYSSILIPTQLNFKLARGELISDQFSHLNLSNGKCEQSTQVENGDIFYSYNRENLVNLKDSILSTLKPNLYHLDREVRDSLTSNDSKHCDENHNHYIIRKSLSTFSLSTDKYSDIDTSTSFLRKSVSFVSSIDSPETPTLRKFRSCLNKLSKDNFEPILDEMRHIPVNDDETVLKLIEILYAKAIKEPMFASNYVKIIKALKNDFVFEKRSFESLAIAACEKGHEEARLKLNKRAELDQDQRDSLRRDLIESMTFLALMHENHILSREFIMKICQELLRFECEESIEPLCKLLHYLSDKINFDHKIKSFFGRINEISHQFSTRIRFKIQDLLENYEDKQKNLEYKRSYPYIPRSKDSWVSRHQKSFKRNH